MKTKNNLLRVFNLIAVKTIFDFFDITNHKLISIEGENILSKNQTFKTLEDYEKE